MYEVSGDQAAEVAADLAADLVAGDGRLTVLPVVGLKEIGWMFRVGWNTPYQWRSRGQLPVEDDTISGNPVWRLQTLYRWAAETNRRIVWDPWGLHASSTLDRGDRDAEPADPTKTVVAAA